MPNNFYACFLKRLLDRLIGLLMLILFFWLLLLIGLAIYLDDPGPVLFCQQRAGMGKSGKMRPFRIYKFRTLRVSAPANCSSNNLEPSAYATRVGTFLRRTSLDELPQLINIAFWGNMSFVGPRPVILEEQELVAMRQEVGVYGVLPGLTGWAQINGRDLLDNQTKTTYDSQYVTALCRGSLHGFSMDVKCLWGTVLVQINGKGAN